jgi:hypothetical protein
MERRKCLIKSLKNELWNFMVDTHAYCTHIIIDRSINVSLWTGCLLGKARIGMSRLCSATFEQLFALGAKAAFFGSSNFKQLFPFCAIFEQLFTRFIFLPLTSKDPGYEAASFSVIFFYLIF